MYIEINSILTFSSPEYSRCFEGVTKTTHGFGDLVERLVELIIKSHLLSCGKVFLMYLYIQKWNLNVWATNPFVDWVVSNFLLSKQLKVKIFELVAYMSFKSFLMICHI